MRGARQARLALALYDEWPESMRRSVMHLHSAAEAHFVAGRAAGGSGPRASREACEHFRASRALLQSIPDALPSSNNGELSRQEVNEALARCTS
jgi:hypothetical protein